ncbi:MULTISPECIES: DUF896 domain-containing protein [Bacillaceae]|uniref:DUF896 domain-containing protein n=1 Tax=Bacillaceae TaxID=186817 RepID=UPI0004790904|nr:MULTISPECIES: DUF896 domain-containing protein [Bacillaceae]UOE96471.1 DUF896 domain-containing protein [Alkalihalobacillus sp. LMS39]
MLSKEKIARINELSQKSKTVGLSSEEAQEQTALRQEYIQSFRSSFENQLHSVKVVDEKGKDVTPAKLKASKQSKGRLKH